MKIQLKNIYISEELSVETTAFMADLHIDHLHVGKASNKGVGETIYTGTTEEGKKLIGEAEQWSSTLPPYVNKDFVVDNKPFSFPMTLELLIEGLVADHVQEMEKRVIRRKMDREMEQAILFGDIDKGYQTIRFQATIEAILKKDSSTRMLYAVIQEKVLPFLKDGEKILNTNIPGDMFEKLGVSAAQIVRPGTEKKLKDKPKGTRGRKPGKRLGAPQG